MLAARTLLPFAAIFCAQATQIQKKGVVQNDQAREGFLHASALHGHKDALAAVKVKSGSLVNNQHAQSGPHHFFGEVGARRARATIDKSAQSGATCATALMLSLSSAASIALSGFGGNIIFLVGWLVCGFFGWTDGKVFTATIVLQIAYASLAVMQSIALREFMPWKSLAWSVVPLGSGCIAGFVLFLVLASLRQVDTVEGYMKLMLSAVLFIVVLIQWRVARRSIKECCPAAQKYCPALLGPTEPKTPRGVEWMKRTTEFLIAFIISRFCYGFLHGVIGVGGPPNMIFASMYNPDKNEYRAVLAWTMLLIKLLILLPIVLWTGVLNFSTQWSLFLLCAVGQLIGLYLGNVASQKIGQASWNLIIYIIMIVASFYLGWSGLATLGTI